jgi:hypothetical protein
MKQFVLIGYCRSGSQGIYTPRTGSGWTRRSSGLVDAGVSCSSALHRDAEFPERDRERQASTPCISRRAYLASPKPSRIEGILTIESLYIRTPQRLWHPARWTTSSCDLDRQPGSWGHGSVCGTRRIFPDSDLDYLNGKSSNLEPPPQELRASAPDVRLALE